MTDAAIPQPADNSADAEPDQVLAGGESAPEQDQIDGIIAQTRSDYRGTDVAEIEARLRQRFESSGIAVDQQAVADFARQIADSAV